MSGAPKGWGPEGVGQRRGGAAKGWGPEGWGAQNFALFFPSPATIFTLSSLAWGSSRGIVVVFEAPGPRMCTFGVLGLSCQTPAAPKQPSKHHQNSTRRPPREGRKERNFGRSWRGAVLGKVGSGRGGGGQKCGTRPKMLEHAQKL